MDRIISLLAALVGLIALGGAILVHVNADAQRSELAAEIAGLRVAMGSAPSMPTQVASSSMPMPSSGAGASSSSASAEVSAAAPTDQQLQIKALQDRIAELEKQNSDQAAALADANAKLSMQSVLSPQVPAGASTASSPASASGEPAALVAGGPTSDCIPLGTRFMGKTGDSFAICKTKAVVKLTDVSDGTATIAGAGPIIAGGFGDLATKGCQVMLFSADTTGYAEMRVSCQ